MRTFFAIMFALAAILLAAHAFAAESNCSGWIDARGQCQHGIGGSGMGSHGYVGPCGGGPVGENGRCLATEQSVIICGAGKCSPSSPSSSK